MTHTTVVKSLAETYPHDHTEQQLWRWTCETRGCTSLGGYWQKTELAAQRGAERHRARHNQGPKALRDLLTLEW